VGLGKTIVDGGLCWTFSPTRPRAVPPFGSVTDLLKSTQVEFWAVNMGRPPAYDPVRETEYLLRAGLAEAEMDGTLRHAASTYDARSDRLVMGTGIPGPRALNFAPLLVLEEIPLTRLIRRLLEICQEAFGGPVEMEFAVTLGGAGERAARFGFLQLRPMVVSRERVEVGERELAGPGAVVASESILGNGVEGGIRDVVYVKPQAFEARHTRAIAAEVATFNHRLLAEGRPYLLVGFGRWGSADPWLGIPVNWGQISGARAIVEATLPEMNVDFSQGSHFFHNMSSFRVGYLAVRHDGPGRIDWEWLGRQEAVAETDFVRHVRLAAPLTVKLDGMGRRGVVLAAAGDADPGGAS
jgi:hypothetical protein